MEVLLLLVRGHLEGGRGERPHAGGREAARGHVESGGVRWSRDGRREGLGHAGGEMPHGGDGMGGAKALHRS